MSRSKINVENQELNADVSFVSRWSRLKHETRQNSENAAVDKTPMQTAVSDEEQQAPVKILTDDDMPDIESMTPDSDYTGFLSPGVSEQLRKLALRKLFRSEVFNIRDGLDEYDGDYTHFEKLGDIVTSDMKHQLELEAKRKAEQILQHENPLDEEDCGSELDLDNDDSADRNRIAANQQGTSQLLQDDAQSLIDTDVTGKKAVTENLPSDYSLHVDAATEKNKEKPDENAGFDDFEYDDRQTNNTDQNKGKNYD